MPKKKRKGFQLRKLEIRNFKAIDHLKIELPAPRMASDVDVFVMGSKNGLGKTSVLECGVLMFLAAAVGRGLFRARPRRDVPLDPYDLFIRAGSPAASITATFDVDGTRRHFAVQIARGGEVEVEGEISDLRKRITAPGFDPSEVLERFLQQLAGLSSDPVLLPPMMYFHSYRRVQEGSLELGTMVEAPNGARRLRFRPGYEPPVSTFKQEILRSMMSQANLFETLDEAESDRTLEMLNHLVARYAGGKIAKLRPSADNTLDFRVTPTTGGESFTFDGLSSGQKEIISTLFLIWKHSQEMPGLVFLDEPELHLNAEWQRDFVGQLREVGPENQWIVATHSEEVFASVPEDRRLILEQ